MTALLNRLHLATRIHFLLLRAVGEGADIGRMLRERSYADHIVMLCRSVGGESLVELADRFDDLGAAEDARAHLAVAAGEARAALAQLGFGVLSAQRGKTAADERATQGLIEAVGRTNAVRGRIAGSRWAGTGHDRRH